MPYLRIQTNVSREPAARGRLLARASACVADALGKPERYVMVALEAGETMVFAGSEAPLAYLELKSIGLPEQSTTELSRALCDLVQDALGVPGERIYIEFTDAPRHLWGWNGGTF